jgi:hypothetical protein
MASLVLESQEQFPYPSLSLESYYVASSDARYPTLFDVPIAPSAEVIDRGNCALLFEPAREHLFSVEATSDPSPNRMTTFDFCLYAGTNVRSVGHGQISFITRLRSTRLQSFSEDEIRTSEIRLTRSTKTAVVATDPFATLLFHSLRSQWVNETAHLSSFSSRRKHPAYQRIVDLGPAVVPMLLGELRERPDFWFSALRAITGADPVEDHMRGKFDEMREAWLNWARERHIVPFDVRQALP